MKKIVDSKEFQEKKKIVLETAPVRKIVNTGDLKIKGDDLFLNDKKLSFSNDGILQLAKMMGIPISFIKKYSNIFGEDTRNKLINHIATGLGSKNKNIMLIGSPNTRKIIDVKSNKHQYISNISFMKLVEDTLNDNKNLEVSNFYVDTKGGLRIDTLNNSKQHNFGKDEDFTAGMNFNQSPSQGTSISQFMLREICKNGMVGVKNVQFNIGFDDDIVKSLYEQISVLAKNDFLPFEFKEKIKRASEVSASLRELNTSFSSFIPKEEFDNFLPYNHIMRNLSQRGIDRKNLNFQQEKNCVIDCTVWDIVNALTDFASHDYGHKISPVESRQIQQHASKLLFTKSFDTENLIIK